MGRTVISKKEFDKLQSTETERLEMERLYQKKLKMSIEALPPTEQSMLVSMGDISLEELGKQTDNDFSLLELIEQTEELAKPQTQLTPKHSIELQQIKPTDFTEPLELDTYTSRLLKYIPAEVIALYLTLDAMIRSSQEISLLIYWLVFGFGILATYLYLWRVAKVTKQVQLLLSVIAYCVWVFALGGPFAHLEWYNSLYGGLLLPSYTFIIALVEA